MNDGPVFLGLRSIRKYLVSFIGLLFVRKITLSFSIGRNRQGVPIATRCALRGVLNAPRAYTGSQTLAIVMQSFAGISGIRLETRFSQEP